MAEESTNNIYQGGYSSFKPSYGNLFTGYHVAASELGAPTKPDTANQLQQVGQLLNQGIVPIEVGVLSLDDFDRIPKQHFAEIRRTAKLGGGKISVHAPMMEPSGIAGPDQKRPWDESYRELAEKQLKEVVNKSVELDDQGGVPITIHSSNIPGTNYKMTPEGKQVEKLIVINKESGEMAPLDWEKKYLPGEDFGKLTIRSPEEQLRMINNSNWSDTMTRLVTSKNELDRMTNNASAPLIPLLLDSKQGDKIELTPEQQNAIQRLQNSRVLLENTQSAFLSTFDKAYKYSDEKDREKLKEISDTWKKGIEDLRKEAEADPRLFQIKQPIIESQLLDDVITKFNQINLESPQIYVPVEDFAIDKSSQTFANVAFDAYKKHGDKAPFLSIETFHPGTAFAYGEDVNKLILESKQKFVDKAVQNGLSKNDAQKQADKLIGATLDVGHFNMMKKQGFSDKDIVNEIKKMAKHVKHVHITDNFGNSDSHLSPGMGNVPFKEIFEELERQGIKNVRKINEAGAFVQHFGVSPFPQTLEAMGSPLYSMQMQPYWNQAVGLQQGYMSGYGEMLSQSNYQMFGAGFSQLPVELGGQRAGAGGSRLGGTPME